MSKITQIWFDEFTEWSQDKHNAIMKYILNKPYPLHEKLHDTYTKAYQFKAIEITGRVPSRIQLTLLDKIRYFLIEGRWLRRIR